MEKEECRVDEIIIKPHHFIEIIKLYGADIERFIPDEPMGHDFYKVANELIDHPTINVKLTVYDDICRPCKKYNGRCVDALTSISWYTGKDAYNRTLDEKLIRLYTLTAEKYTALQLCSIILEKKAFIYTVWNEEEPAFTQNDMLYLWRGQINF